jgi:hypothetical protein
MEGMAIDQGIDERRRYPRVALELPATLWVDEESIVGRTIDVSAYGLFVATAPTAALRVGTSVRIEIVAGTPFTALAEIRHVSERGVGMETRDPLPVRWTE